MSKSFIEGDIVKSNGCPEMHVLDIFHEGSKELLCCFWWISYV